MPSSGTGKRAQVESQCLLSNKLELCPLYFRDPESSPGSVPASHQLPCGCGKELCVHVSGAPGL